MAPTFSQDELEAVGHVRVREYLIGKGWTEATEFRGKPGVSLWTRLGFKVFTVSTVYGDYLRRLAETINDIANVEGRSLYAVYRDLIAK